MARAPAHRAARSSRSSLVGAVGPAGGCDCGVVPAGTCAVLWLMRTGSARGLPRVFLGRERRGRSEEGGSGTVPGMTTTKIDAGRIGAKKIGAGEIGATQIGAGEIGATQIGATAR